LIYFDRKTLIVNKVISFIKLLRTLIACSNFFDQRIILRMLILNILLQRMILLL